MHKLYCYLLWIGLLALWPCALLAQAPASAPVVVRVDSFPASPILLNKGWRYHPGDDPAWARPDFDDRGWDTITVARDNLPMPLYGRQSAGWFRLHLRLADSLRYQAMSLDMYGLLAGMEIYLDGRLLNRYGTFSTDLARVRPGTLLPEPINFAAPRPDLLLAVRFAPWQPAPWQRFLANNPLSNLHLELHGQRWAQLNQKNSLNGQFWMALTDGVLLLLGILHLVFFRYNPAQQANRYFAFYALITAASSLAINIFYTQDFWLGFALVIVGILVRNLALLAGLRAVYALFNVRPGWYFTCLFAYILVLAALFTSSLMLLFTNPYVTYGTQILSLLVTVDLLRLIGRAVRQRRRGVWLIGAGFGLGLVLLALWFSVGSATNTWFSEATWLTILSSLYFLAKLLPPLGISLYLAREFALDGQLLQVKLGEVERLSAQTLAQEQEKQTLLAAQNETLETQVQQRTSELQRSLTELRATQAQLIQKEKMASLGELTAGIAHEIQNPLNFVNNFADVSQELVQELKEAQATGDTEEATALTDDLGQNLSKIHLHGQRAASIVRGMLEHSRTSTGERQPTDLNALAEEYLRLAYHGLRARDKTFNATLETDLAPGLPLVAAVGQDIGRVLLNLFTNAFYAVQQRQRQGEASYEPTVRVRTQLLGQQVEVQVQDNGVGMSPAVQAKVFQPFFTTKPAGEGTGLGLSLAHDMVVQGHGGTLQVASTAGEGTTFTLRLPLGL